MREVREVRTGGYYVMSVQSGWFRESRAWDIQILVAWTTDMRSLLTPLPFPSTPSASTN